MKMKAIVTIGPKKSIIKEFDIPEMNDDSVKIKIKYCGVCHSEHYAWAHSETGGTFGHEPMGTIVEVGKNVKDFRVGDRVSGLWGSTLPGAGAMVEYAVANVNESTIVKLPDSIRDEDLVVEPLACLFSACSKISIGMPGTKACVVGTGYMGCGMVSLLKMRGFHVVAVDIRESSRQDALKYGADEVYSPEEAIAKFIKNDPVAPGTIDAGFEVVTEWGETNESLDLAINLTKKCGHLYVGAYHTGPKRLVDMQQLNLKAIIMNNVHPRESWLSDIGARNAVRLLESGEWNFKNIPTMVYPMNMFDRAHEEMETKYGHHMKALINMEMIEGEPFMAK
ncbi:MAG: zinc-dependent alcohol dehydrogenase [Christensenellales bacterium]|jgi:L-iditol 2-dehydrogenase